MLGLRLSRVALLSWPLPPLLFSLVLSWCQGMSLPVSFPFSILLSLSLLPIPCSFCVSLILSVLHPLSSVSFLFPASPHCLSLSLLPLTPFRSSILCPSVTSPTPSLTVPAPLLPSHVGHTRGLAASSGLGGTQLRSSSETWLGEQGDAAHLPQRLGMNSKKECGTHCQVPCQG